MVASLSTDNLSLVLLGSSLDHDSVLVLFLLGHGFMCHVDGVGGFGRLLEGRGETLAHLFPLDCAFVDWTHRTSLLVEGTGILFLINGCLVNVEFGRLTVAKGRGLLC